MYLKIALKIILRKLLRARRGWFNEWASVVISIYEYKYNNVDITLSPIYSVGRSMIRHRCFGVLNYEFEFWGWDFGLGRSFQHWSYIIHYLNISILCMYVGERGLGYRTFALYTIGKPHIPMLWSHFDFINPEILWLCKIWNPEALSSDISIDMLLISTFVYM